jgi:hypothetical protein
MQRLIALIKPAGLLLGLVALAYFWSMRTTFARQQVNMFYVVAFREPMFRR